MRFTTIIPILAIISATIAHADTIVLKSGKKLEGKVLSEDEKSYLVEVQVTKTIKDEKRIPKDHIDEIIKEKEDSKAFTQIAKLIPTADMLPAEAYAPRINATKAFLSEFPKSSHAKEARKVLTTLESEQKIISAGGIKLDGQLIPKSDLEANAYEIHARIILNEITTNVEKGHHRLALTKWETLQNDYKNSSAFQKAAPLVTKILRSYQAQLKQMESTMDARIAKRKSALETMNQNDRDRTLAVLAEQEKKYQALLEKEKDQLKLKWVTVDPYSEEAIKHNLKNTDTALKATANLALSEIKQAGPIYRATWSALANGKLDDATKSLQELRSIRIPARYIEPFEADIAKQQESQKRAAEAQQKAAEAEKARQEKLAKEAAEEEAKKKGKKSRGKKRR